MAQLNYSQNNMEGTSSCYEDWRRSQCCIVGHCGNGKSATGNSIVGIKAFKSMSSSAGVTTTCQWRTTVLADGQILNVIDTPGPFMN